MAEKTPVSILQELCVKYKDGAPLYEEIPDESEDGKTFACIVQAFGATAQGAGRSKREAKHTASAKLITYLKMQDRFKNDLPTEVPQAPRTTSEIDAVGTLLDICVQRNFPLPTFKVEQACGPPHAPEFTVVCQLASIKRKGTSSTKKNAKQLAAQIMVDVVQSFQIGEEKKQIAPFKPEPLEKVVKTYRELKKSDIKPMIVRFPKRHNYFVRFSDELKMEAHGILYGEHTDHDAVDLLCKALQIPYDVQDVPKHPGQLKAFIMRGDYDCVITGREHELWPRIVDYLKTMFNFQQEY